MREVSRREAVRALGATVVGGTLAGCSGDDTEADVEAGPGGRNVFEPAEYTVSAGDTVEWVFASPEHNVSGVPDHSPQTQIPDGADPFASYGASGNPNETAEQGTTFEHTFETPGEYTYVCIPHIRSGMVGTVVVEG